MHDAAANPAWFYALGSDRRGPIARAELASMLASGVLSGATLVWTSGMQQWVSASEVPSLWGDAPEQTPSAPAPPPLPIGHGATPSHDGLGLAAIIVGALALFPGGCSWIIGGPLGVVGLVVGLKSSIPGGVRTAGIVVSCVALAWAVVQVLMILVFVVIGALSPGSGP